jgi:hypothetical protein
MRVLSFAEGDEVCSSGNDVRERSGLATADRFFKAGKYCVVSAFAAPTPAGSMLGACCDAIRLWPRYSSESGSSTKSTAIGESGM